MSLRPVHRRDYVVVYSNYNTSGSYRDRNVQINAVASRANKTIFESERVRTEEDRNVVTREHVSSAWKAIQRGEGEGEGGDGRRGEFIYYVLLTHVTSVTWDHYNRANDNENANESARALIWICVSAISLNNNRRITITRDLRDLTGRRESRPRRQLVLSFVWNLKTVV